MLINDQSQEDHELFITPRRITDAPVIIFGSGGLPGLVSGLASGADAHLDREAGPLELIVRICAILGRFEFSRSFKRGPLIFDQDHSGGLK